MASSSSIASAVRLWRTVFLTLRDETLTNPPRTSIPQLLQNLIFSSNATLISAVTHLSPHEVTSDILFLLELVSVTKAHEEDMASTYTNICCMVNDVCRKVSLDIKLSSWLLILESFKKMVEVFLWKDGSECSFTGTATRIRYTGDCLETLRRLIGLYHGKCSGSDNEPLVRFLLHIIASTHAELTRSIHLSSNQLVADKTEKRVPRYSIILEIHPLIFNMLAEAFSRVGSSFTPDIWRSTVEVLRKVMDVVASKSLLLGDRTMSRFYESLLHCLHMVIAEPKCSLSDHVSGFIAALRMFLNYRLYDKPQITGPSVGHHELEGISVSTGVNSDETTKTNKGRYMPPHLRRRENIYVKGTKDQDSHSLPYQELSIVETVSSDSDYSDSEGALKDSSSIRSAKVRVAAITCIQDLCQADPKSFTTQWTTLLPTSNVLEPRKFEVTLLTCLLYDPYLKARIAAASTIAVMLVGSSSFSLQVAEYKETSKHGSFMSLSSSIGQILMQLHRGILYLIQHENHTKLLSSTFKILTILISSTPYSRMHAELLPSVVTSLSARIHEGFHFKSDPTSLMAAAINCLTGALSTSPPYQKVNDIFLEEISTGFHDTGKSCHILSTLFQHSRSNSPTICFEALQSLRAVSHNYPNVMFSCWKCISMIVYEIVSEVGPEMPVRSWKGHAEETAELAGEKVITAAIKVLDECLRAISGFKGTENLLDDKSMETPFTSDFVREKKISSAPSYGPDSMENTSCLSGTDEWSEAIEKHLPLVMRHSSAMVRTASVTCFAGITSSVFFSVTKEKQEFIISSVTSAAEYDKIPSVRSAACRAIGVISFFPQISLSAEILDKFIHAVEINTRDPLVSVRITASWAWANICDAVRSCIDPSTNSQLIELLTDCALHLTKDGDKIKSNAVRALGNLSRFVKMSLPGVQKNTVKGITSLPMKTGLQLGDEYYSRSCYQASWVDSFWVDKVVQAFLSCVATGNVKVQWNVCHALGNLFLNETLRLQDMDWGSSVFSILLLLLRDSSNFKIRIQAAAALAVPESALDYGTSFSDVVQGVAHVLENLGSDQNLASISFKYRVALQNQLTSTMLHTLILASRADNQPTEDFLIRKSLFLAEWFKVLCSSFANSSSQLEDENSSPENQKKEIITKALQSLVEVYRGRNLNSIAQKFENFKISMQVQENGSCTIRGAREPEKFPEDQIIKVSVGQMAI